MKTRGFQHYVVRAWCALSIVACSSPLTDDTRVGERKHDIIAGFSANNSALDAIGAIDVFYETDGYRSFDLLCTGALINPTTVLTAKHCVQQVNDSLAANYRFVFGIGPNALDPKFWSEVVATESAPGDDGGFIRRGRDVGVLHLATPITSVVPLPFASLQPEQVGLSFVGIGYGVQDSIATSGTRRLGSFSVRANRGRTFEALFGSFSAFFTWYTGAPPPELCGDGDADAGIDDPAGECAYTYYLRSVYDSERLDDTNEIVAGGLHGNATACYGDSGGPLLRADASGQLHVYGVVSGGISSVQLACDYGNVYAGFDAGTLAFIEHALLWVDPCAGLSVIGTCDGSVAKRCTTLREGLRRAVQLDCGAVGLTCETQRDGSIGCGADDQSFVPPVVQSEPPSGAAKYIPNVFIAPQGQLPTD